MRCYLATVAILAVLVSGCASQGSRTDQRSIANQANGGNGETQRADVDSKETTPDTPAVATSPPKSGGIAASKTPRAASGALVGPMPYQKGRTTGAISEAVGGGLGTRAAGPYMNSQKQDLQKTLQDELRSGAASVEKLPHNVVRIRMHARAAFDTDSASIKPGFCTTMDKVADVVVRYGKTTLVIVGPSDNKGTAEHNRKLSRQRALSVAHYLESKEINPMRLATLGRTTVDPATGGEPGRQENRRVEILVEPVLAK